VQLFKVTIGVYPIKPRISIGELTVGLALIEFWD